MQLRPELEYCWIFFARVFVRSYKNQIGHQAKLVAGSIPVEGQGEISLFTTGYGIVIQVNL